MKSKPTGPVIRAIEDLTLVSYPDLDVPGIAHGIVVVKDPTSDRSTCVERARDHVSTSLRTSFERLVVPDQIHSNRVMRVRASDGAATPQCDALITDQVGIAIGVTVADCIPVFALNTEDGVVGVAHSGWKGMASGLLEEFVAALLRTSCHPSSTRYLIGASIGECCYEVGEDLLTAFGEDEVRSFARHSGGKTYFDLKSAAGARLVKMGVSPAMVAIDGTCTACRRDTLCSYRADGKGCGHMLAYIMLTG